MSELLIKGLPFGSDEDFVKKLIVGGDSALGKIKILPNGGAAFVSFTNKEQAKRNLECLDGYNKQKCKLKVSMARPLKTGSKIASRKILNDKPRTVFIGNLDYETKENSLRQRLLASYIEGIESISVVPGKGAAFVRCENIDTANKIVSELSDKEYLGRRIRLNTCENKERLNLTSVNDSQ